MPAKDIYHDVVKNALIKDGWTILADSYTLEYEDDNLIWWYNLGQCGSGWTHLKYTAKSCGTGILSEKGARKRVKMGKKAQERETAPEKFELPFEEKLASDNRWVIMAKMIPWSEFDGELSEEKRVKGRTLGRSYQLVVIMDTYFQITLVGIILTNYMI